MVYDSVEHMANIWLIYGYKNIWWIYSIGFNDIPIPLMLALSKVNSHCALWLRRATDPTSHYWAHVQSLYSFLVVFITHYSPLIGGPKPWICGARCGFFPTGPQRGVFIAGHCSQWRWTRMDVPYVPSTQNLRIGGTFIDHHICIVVSISYMY